MTDTVLSFNHNNLTVSFRVHPGICLAVTAEMESDKATS